MTPLRSDPMRMNRSTRLLGAVVGLLAALVLHQGGTGPPPLP